MKTSSTLLLVFVAILVVAGGIFLIVNNNNNSGAIGQAINTQPAPSSVNTDTQTPIESVPAPTTTPPSSATEQVVMQRLMFSPATLTVNVGDTVIWTNMDTVAHRVVSDTGNELNSLTLGQGQIYSHTFTKQGTYDYHDSIESYMTGKIIVQ